MKRPVALVLAGLAGQLAGCVGQIDSSGGGADAATPRPDAGDGPGATFRLMGELHDYAEAAPVPNAAITTIGLTPPVETTSNALGVYVLDGIAPGSAFYAHVMPEGATYRPTINQAVVMLDQDITLNLSAVSAVYAQRQHATAGLEVQANTSIVLVELVKPDGSPWEGLTAPAITIEPVGGGVAMGQGPYFIGANGDIDLLLTQSTAFGGRARAAFLNVPPGSYSMYARGTAGPDEGGGLDGGLPPPGDAGLPPGDAGLPPGDGGVEPPPPPEPIGTDELATAPVMTVSDAQIHGATLILLRKIGGGGDGGGGGGGGEPTTFTNDVYPLLQRASAGGQGCASCHTAGGAAGLVLILDDGAPAVHARLIADPTLVNLPAPADSLLLTKPLYESPPNHPNATWLDTNDPAYQLILAWITAGAPL